MLAESGWSYMAQWMTVLILAGVVVAVVMSIQRIRRGNRGAWLGIAGVVVVLTLMGLVQAPVSTSSHSRPVPVSHNQP